MVVVSILTLNGMGCSDITALPVECECMDRRVVEKCELQGEFQAGKRLVAGRTPPAETELPSFLLPSLGH